MIPDKDYILKKGEYSQEAICKECGHIFIVLAKLPTHGAICPRCLDPELFKNCPRLELDRNGNPKKVLNTIFHSFNIIGIPTIIISVQTIIDGVNIWDDLVLRKKTNMIHKRTRFTDTKLFRKVNIE